MIGSADNSGADKTYISVVGCFNSEHQLNAKTVISSGFSCSLDAK